MPITFQADFRPQQAQLDNLAKSQPGLRGDILRQIGFVLVIKQKQHFQQLSRTGSSNGVTWRRQSPQTLKKRQRLQRQGRLAAAPEQQGIESGNTAGGFLFKASVTDNSVKLMSKHSAAGFLKGSGRPPFPNTIPANWIDSAERVTQRRLDRLYA